MKNFSRTTNAEPSLTSNRRQPLRQTRTNPSRSATMVGPQRSSGTSKTTQDDSQDTELGFYPAITHFTDAIAALPKEMIRHYSMLKEVDAKICGPEEAIGQLVTTALRTPAPPRKPAIVRQPTDTSRSEIDTTASTTGTADNISLKSVPSRAEAASTATQENLATFDLSRRQLFYKLRVYMQEMLPILDEKNHVLSTASECLENQLKRCNGSYQYMNNELSEEARYGSLTHWAYNKDKEDKKGTTAGERSRRDAAAANHLAANAPAVHEAEGAALRSELRREAMAARKSRNHHLESDFDEARGSLGKRSHAVSKGRKVADATPSINGAAVGLGIANGVSTAAPPSKRRKVEKTGPGAVLGGVPMVRAMSSVYGSNTGSTRAVGTSPRATPALEPPKKRGRAAAVPNGTGRRRANTNTSAANSPSMASSPVVGTFSASKDIPSKSPAPSLMQRIPSSRGRQNSTQSSHQEARNRQPPATANKATSGNGIHGTVADVEKVAGPASRNTDDVKTSTRDAVPASEEQPAEEDSRADGNLRGGAPTVGNRGTNKLTKKEDSEISSSKAREDRPRSISISTRGNGKVSKRSTPTQGSFSESQRTRPVRGADPLKRSHKKGAGLAAQLAATQRLQDGDASSLQGDDDEDDEDSEPRYCYCNQVSYGEMVACDMDNCPREWFHLDCVGLSKAPKGNAKWFCDECKETLKKGKLGNGNGNSR